MIITFRNNFASNFAALAVNNNQMSLIISIAKLASGLKITKASDDPAGLVISEQLRTQIASLNQEIENISMNIGKYQTVSGTVGEMRNQLIEIRTLAVGAANSGGNSEEAQAAYALAADALVESFNFSRNNSTYNGVATLDGSAGSLANVDELSGIDLSTPEGAVAAINQIDAASSQLDEVQIDLGSTQRYDLESHKATLEVTRQNLVSAESQIRDLDVAREYSNMIASMIGLQLSTALLSHSNLTNRSVINLLYS